MLHRQPFVGFVLSYIAGIMLSPLLAKYVQISPVVLIGFTSLLFMLMLGFYKRQAHAMVSVLFALFLLACGLARMGMVDVKMQEELSFLKTTDYRQYVCMVTSLAEKRTKTVRYEVQVMGICQNQKWTPFHTKALIQMAKDSPLVPESGDYLIVSGKLAQPLPALNPEEFDYQQYLQRKGIFWTAYLNEPYFQVIKSDHYKVWQWPIFASEWADQQFRRILQDDDTYGLVKAMLLGRRDDLRTAQIDDYITSGTVHILSVSGMHVMLIFIVLKWMLGWVKKLPQGKYLFLLAICLFLVFYALITGLQPSVQRATCMCLVMVLAETFHKKPDTVNILAVSAFLILLFDPMAFYDVGFQLSYLAMLGIFLFYKPLEALLQTDRWIYQSVWQMTVMSFAAQLATFPLSIYYFHQFPLYFWLINPLVIAATNILLPAAMALLGATLLPFSFLQQGIGWLVGWSAYLANASVSIPSKLPHYLLESLYLDRLEVYLLYGMMLLIWYALDRRQIRLFRWVLLSIFPFALYGMSMGIQTYYTSKAIIHAIPKHTVLTVKEGSKMFVFSDAAFRSDTQAIQFHLKNYMIREGIDETVYVNAEEAATFPEIKYQMSHEGEAFIYWKNKVIYYGNRLPAHPEIDYHILKGNVPRNSGNQAGKMPAHLFLSGEMSQTARRKWEERLNQWGLPFYALTKSGAYSVP